jgi:hypothetical protein
MNDNDLSKLIGQAAKNNNLPEIRRVNRPHSPGFIDVYLCGIEVQCFDTYYYTASNKASELVSSLNLRIRQCASNIINEKDEYIEVLKCELNKGKAKIKNQKVEITNLNAALKEHKA